MKNNIIQKGAPAITLMLLAPLIAEVLPGATRFSSIFVFPIEVCVWGGGALIIRYMVRKLDLGWINMLLLALALSVAEEFLIQQTSIAPMVVKIKGVTYARAFGINYVYLLWALVYESVFVVFLPVYLTELIFPGRRMDLWIGKRGLVILSILFLLGCVMAWYSWTQIARLEAFHVDAYNPSSWLVIIAIVLISCLIFAAAGPYRKKLMLAFRHLNPPAPWVLIVFGSLWAIVLYGIVLLAFGILPSFPPLAAILTGLALGAIAIYFVPRWTVHENWQARHMFSLIFGVMLGSMGAGFIGFIGASRIDLYFKIIADAVAVALMILLKSRMGRQTT